MSAHPHTRAENRENEAQIESAANKFMILADKFTFKPELIGDSTHLSDRKNLRGDE